MFEKAYTKLHRATRRYVVSLGVCMVVKVLYPANFWYLCG